MSWKPGTLWRSEFLCFYADTDLLSVDIDLWSANNDLLFDDNTLLSAANDLLSEDTDLFPLLQQ